MKQCPKCQRILPDSYFAANTKHCKICRRDYDWQYRYGVSPEQYYEMWKAQGGKCKICGKELPDGEYLQIDHDKQTGEIRGLLCPNCNKGLGMFKDNPDNFKGAIEYVKSSNNR